MDREQLRVWIEEEGLSLPKIGALVQRDPSTVGYWVKKHGLTANGRDKLAPRGGIDEEVLEILCGGGATLEEMAAQLDRSPSTIRYWLKVYGLETSGRRGPRSRGGESRPNVVQDVCPHHGLAEFILENRGAYRCKRCRSDAVTRWRRRVSSS